MVDNVIANAGAGGATFASDDIDGVQYPRTKLSIGADGSAADLEFGQKDDTLSLPVTLSTAQGTALTDLGDSIDGNGYVQVTLKNNLLNPGVVYVQDGSITIANPTFEVTQDTASVLNATVVGTGTFVVQENGAALTSLQLIDDSVATLGTTTYTEATTKGLTIGVVRRDADTTLVNTTNEIGPMQMDARGCLKVECFSGETLPVSLTSTTITGTVAATQSGTWNIGSITTLPALVAGTAIIGQAVPAAHATLGGQSIYRSLDLDEGTLEIVKGSAGKLYGFWVTNRATSTRWVKFYNATSGTVGTGTPVITIGIPGNTTDNISGFAGSGDGGVTFATGICIGASTGFADNDTGAPGTNDVIINVFYS